MSQNFNQSEQLPSQVETACLRTANKCVKFPCIETGSLRKVLKWRNFPLMKKQTVYGKLRSATNFSSDYFMSKLN